MRTRPIIIYIGEYDDAYQDYGTQQSRALVYHFQTTFNCEVRTFQYFDGFRFREEWDRTRRAIIGQRVVALILPQEWNDEHLRHINKIRSIHTTLPIIVVPNHKIYPEVKCEGIQNDDNVFVWYPQSKECLEFLQKRCVSFRPSVNFFGTETEEDQDLLMRQLARAHEAKMDGACVTGVSDFNSSVVAEAIRFRLLPVQFYKEEFDDLLEVVHTPPPVSLDEYDDQRAKIRAFNDEERKAFYDLLHEQEGLRNGKRTRVSLGENIVGFAFDPITLQHVEISTFGLHHYAGRALKGEIEAIEELNGAILSDQIADERCVEGLLHYNVPGFTFPILTLSGDIPKQYSERAIAFFRELRYIPLD